MSEVIEGRLISDASELVATLDEPVRAIDLLGRFAAVYRFSADDDDPHRAVRLRLACVWCQRERGKQQQCEKTPHQCGFTRKESFSKHLA